MSGARDVLDGTALLCWGRTCLAGLEHRREEINALNRENASSLTPTLEYNPAGDRPAVTMKPEGGLPFFPSGGFRVRF